MQYEIQTTAEFDGWVAKLKDRQARKALALRIARIEAGNFGDHKRVGGGVSELRIFVGKGYRIYYTVRKHTVVILLCGGGKDSQSRDIEEARQLTERLPE